jgi:DNA polymerase-3 subunit gamma/tau
MDELFPDATPQPPKTGYRVLARKYRPSTFDDLIGQEAMVRTLANAFAAERIHQAYILTGVRGVGKTTTARILARAFNYEIPGKVSSPSIDMPVFGLHCEAIIESRHVDVIEMDAASHTGIDDVREIIENARYRPISARTKVYIIDEVHMLSKAAFNGLLKTLEEPPEHVKFLFATTEIDKVPITVRSRCIRFDLKRIDAPLLVRHLTKICELEHVQAEPEALALIARVAEGSVRDSLSLLDQAIAHGGADGVRVVDLRTMLGLSDRGDIVELFELAMRGKIGEALEIAGRLYRAGADPSELLLELSEFCHYVTRVKISERALEDPAISEFERRRGAEIAKTLSMGVLTRAWTLIMNGYEDVKDSPRPLASAEMALIRIGYAADLPSPEDALRKLAEGGAVAAPRPAPAMAAPTVGPRDAGARNCRRSECRATASSFRGRGCARSRQARRRADARARTRHAHRPLRAGPHRIHADSDRFADLGADAGEKTRRMDRRTVDDRDCAGRDGADAARDRGCKGRRKARGRRRPPRGAKSARAVSRRANRRDPRARGHRARSAAADRAAGRGRRLRRAAGLRQRFLKGTIMDIMGIMKKAQAMQSKLAETQEELGKIEVEGESGGGLVKVTLSGKAEMKSIKLDPSLMKPEEVEMAEDLIVAAFNDAKAKAERAAAEKMQEVTAGLPLPPGMKLPF